MVEIGGISYRKDCLSASGGVVKSWTFTWFAPIPFVFRPSEPGCEVHTGIRVALNAVGIAPIKEVSLAGEASELSNDSRLSKDQRYFAAMTAATTSFSEYQDAHQKDPRRVLAEMRKTAAVLADLEPPVAFATDHATIVAAWRRMASLLQQFLAAQLAGNQAEAYRVATAMLAEDKRQKKLLRRIFGDQLTR